MAKQKKSLPHELTSCEPTLLSLITRPGGAPANWCMTSADALVNIKLTQIVRQRTACLALLSIPGIGLMTATAMVTATSGSVAHFKDARHFASWFGFTPKEYLSGNTRYIGHISKRGDSYLRMLLTHCAHSVLRAASISFSAGRHLDELRSWVLKVQGANQSQQSSMLPCQQARAHLLCNAADGEDYGTV